MKAIVIGGTGLLSRPIVSVMVNEGIETTIINRGNHPESIPKGVEMIKCDINNSERIKEILKNRKFDVAIDFISYTVDNLNRSFSLLKEYVKQYIFISSCAVYNQNPPWSYGVNKLKCEFFLKKAAQESNIAYTVIRPCVTYGNSRIPYGIMPSYGFHGTLIQRIIHNKPILVWNNGENRCNITHVDDFSKYFIQFVGNKKAYNCEFNVMGNEVKKWSEVLDTIETILHKKIIRVNVPSTFMANIYKKKSEEIIAGRSIDEVYSNDKMKSIIPKFTQDISLKEGIGKTIEYYKKNNYLRGIDYEYDGITDRIVSLYQKKNNKKFSNNISYIDYLNHKKITDHLEYLSFRYNLPFIDFAIRATRKIRRVINVAK